MLGRVDARIFRLVQHECEEAEKVIYGGILRQIFNEAHTKVVDTLVWKMPLQGLGYGNG